MSYNAKNHIDLRTYVFGRDVEEAKVRVTSSLPQKQMVLTVDQRDAIKKAAKAKAEEKEEKELAALRSAVNKEADAINFCPNDMKTWSEDLTRVVLGMRSMQPNAFDKLLTCGGQKGKNRKGVSLNEFALNHGALIRTAFGLSKDNYDWTRIKQGFSANDRRR